MDSSMAVSLLALSLTGILPSNVCNRGRGVEVCCRWEIRAWSWYGVPHHVEFSPAWKRVDRLGPEIRREVSDTSIHRRLSLSTLSWSCPCILLLTGSWSCLWGLIIPWVYQQSVVTKEVHADDRHVNVCYCKTPFQCSSQLRGVESSLWMNLCMNS